MDQLHEYDTFHDKGIGTTPGEKFKKIRVHLVYACKHDGRHKARLCANGNLTDIPVNSIYSGVVSLKSLRTVIFLAELNGLETWATGIGNAYLEAETSEKVFIIAGPKFGELEGHTLVIFKALYGLRSSGLRWSEKFSLCLPNMGFFASLADPCIWMCRVDNHYEYILRLRQNVQLVLFEHLLRTTSSNSRVLVSSSCIWDAMSSVTKKVFHVLHLASTSISSLRHSMSACLGQSQRQTRLRLH
jgi:hypothetical protein